MQCLVYKSLKQQNYYLYVASEEGLARVPDGLHRLLGALQPVIELRLGADRRLAQADVSEVMRQIEDCGYYLQMPPQRRGDPVVG